MRDQISLKRSSWTFHPLECGDYIFICRQNKHIMSGIVSPQSRNVIHSGQRDSGIPCRDWGCRETKIFIKFHIKGLRLFVLALCVLFSDSLSVFPQAWDTIWDILFDGMAQIGHYKRINIFISTTDETHTWGKLFCLDLIFWSKYKVLRRHLFGFPHKPIPASE